MPIKKTRGDRAADWIERYCRRRGQPLQLTIAEVVLLRRLYDEGEKPQLDAVLSAAVVLMHLCGREHDNEIPSHITADIFTLLQTAGPELSNYLERDGASIVCHDLEKRYPPSAA